MIHVLLVPAAIVALLALHLAVLWRQKHTQFRGRGRTERNVVGSRLWPTYAVKSVGLLALVAGVVALLGGLVQINPIWLYGPFSAPAVTTAAQPDWFLGWVEGALRLMPPALVHLGPYSISEIFWPAVLLPTLTFAALYAWPFLEARVTHDHDEHHLLDRPSDRPVRTAIGVLVVAVPILAGSLTWKVCHDLQRGDHAGRLEQSTPPPVALNEPPADVLVPRVAAATPVSRLRRVGSRLRHAVRTAGAAVWSLVILVALRRAGRPKPRAR